ncbi:hypothetical protein [uncultured Sunxiuqinia sp.]|uniref:hypothetical protein n=1 Tax=uncultured Sunxiuqinia sp. TaxID=1573825 RepID=UPI002AA7DE50|nr:hypothetical protein [uncultured Sunxiuqinia sp.]
MVRNSVFLLLFFLPVSLSVQTAEKSAHSTEQTRGSCYTNPILPGDYPIHPSSGMVRFLHDPLVIRILSEFADMAFQSLVHWEPVCRALHKNTYLLGIRDTYNQQR